jgi:hypothetical protein
MPTAQNAPCQIALASACRNHGNQSDGDAWAEGQPSLVLSRLPMPGVPQRMQHLGGDGPRWIHLTLPPANGPHAMTTALVPNGKATPLPRMFSMAEVATMFGRAPRTIRSWIARGLLKPIKVGNAVFIPQAQIDALMGTPEPSDPGPFDGSENPGISVV